METDTEKLAHLVKGIPVAMLTTHLADGTGLRSRPMTLPERHFKGTFRFLAGEAASLATDIHADPRVSLSFVSAESGVFVSVTGRADISHDREKLKELWSPAYKAWFPDGLEDPSLCLVTVHVESADFWEAPHSAATQLAGFARSVLSRQRTGARGHLELGPPWH